MELFRLFGSILIDDQDAIESLKSVDKKGKDTAGGLENIINNGAKIGASIVAGVTTAYGSMMALASSTADTADKWDKLSLRTGIGVENLQRWGYAADQSGADIGKLEVGMKKLSDSMVDAQNGSKTAMSAYEELGISMEELSTMTPEQAFERVMYSLADMEEGAKRNSVGNDLLGKSYTELLPLIAQGGDGIDDLKNRADDLGIVMSEDAVNSGVVFGDTLADVKNSLGAAKDKVMMEFMPSLTEMLNWVLDHMPQIQEMFGNVLGFVQSALGFVGDNAHILIPILGILFGAFAALQIIGVIQSLMTAWNTVTVIATGVQNAFNLVMAGNPIALVILAIVALIAAGVALWQNWDTVVAFAKDLWTNISNIFNNIKNVIAGVFDSIVKTADSTWNGIKNSISGAIDGAKNAVGNAIDAIKGFLSFNWSWPHIPLPHFSFSGSMNPLDWLSNGLPTIGIDWYAKGGIMNAPTIFGMNGSNLMVGGEVPGVREAVLPLTDSNLAGIGRGIWGASNQDSLVPYLDKIVNLLVSILSRNPDIWMDNEKLGRLIYPEISKLVAREGY